MYDLLVIGLGIYGSAIAAEASASGLSVLAVDQFTLLHDRGSSGGSSRIFRLTTVEGERYIPRARRALDLWKAYDAAIGGELIVPMGLAIGVEPGTGGQQHHGVDRLATRAAKLAERHSIPHELISGDEFTRRFPDFDLGRDDHVFYEPGAFVLKTASALRAMKARMDDSKRCEVVVGARVAALSTNSDGVQAVVDGDIVRAKRAIVCTGPWQTEALLGKNVVPATVLPQVTLRVEVAPTLSGSRNPALVYVSQSQPLTYYVPDSPGLAEVKVGIEQSSYAVANPDDPVAAPFVSDMTRQIKGSVGRMVPGLRLEAAAASTCFYTVTAGSRHVLRYADRGKRILVVAACSGHGFKFAPAVAEEVVASVRQGI